MAIIAAAFRLSASTGFASASEAIASEAGVGKRPDAGRSDPAQ
ncbi:hypothetical protein OTB20_23115 [Streptomyces sp. H27-H1]|nr:hypothetical protein [Streptomyces sp. H27-H1]MCY0929039.1 hypothetical protein [Streptomyces sp. H27-H1]